MSLRLYMDDNASAPLRESAKAAAMDAMSCRNASAVHAEGRAARSVLDSARECVAAFAGCRAEDVTFTASGSEANATALSPDLRLDRCSVTHLLVSAIEHPSVATGGRFEPEHVQTVSVLASGVVDLEALEERLSTLGEDSVPLVSIMAANNETGVVQPMAAIADIVHAHGGVLHCDAVQIAGRIDFADATQNADIISLSSHKLGGLTGAGALALRNRNVTLSSLVTGGGQEHNRRAGTEAVASIAAFGAAVNEAQSEKELWKTVAVCRDAIETHIRNTMPDAVIAGADAPRLPNTIQVIVPGMKAETAVIAFDLAGAALSSGSACSSGKVAASPVLKAMGYDDQDSASALRISLPRTTTESEAEQFCAIWDRVMGTVRKDFRENTFDTDETSVARGAA